MPGHILESQAAPVEVQELPSTVEHKRQEIYPRDSQPVRGEEPGLEALGELREVPNRLKSALVGRLNEVNEANLEREAVRAGRKRQAGWWLVFLHFPTHIISGS